MLFTRGNTNIERSRQAQRDNTTRSATRECKKCHNLFPFNVFSFFKINSWN